MTGDLVKICFTLNPDDWHGTPGERLWAKPIPDAAAPSAYELDNSPFFAKGVSYRDIVRAVEVDGALEFAGVIAHSGRSTYRILIDRETDAFRDWWSRLNALGCTYEKGDVNGRKLLSVDVPPEADIHAVHEILVAGKRNKIWLFELGYLGHPLRDDPASSPGM